MSNGFICMRRHAIVLFLSAAAFSQSACGDPIVVLGESPGTVRNVAGVGDSAGTRIDSVATRNRLLNPTAVAFNDQTLKLYLADRGASTTQQGAQSPAIRIFSVTSGGTIARELDAGGCVGASGICTSEATDMLFGDVGTLIIADAVRHRVTTFNVDTHVQTLIAGTGVVSPAVEGANAKTNPISGPSGVARASDGTLYVSESNSGRVLSIGADGVYHVVAGGGSSAVTQTPVAATSARMTSPAGLALDGNTLYIADRDHHMVYSMDLLTKQIVAFAGDGVPAFGGDDGDALFAHLSSPHDLVLSADGTTLYISDSSNNRVRSVNLTSHIIRTYMGSGSGVYNGDRVAAGAVSLKNPLGLAVSALGYLFVADQFHAVIRRATTSF
jgi:sugar lactone lactonase YvrE